MLTKLFRYEIKCTLRTFGPMLLAMLLFTLLTKGIELLCGVLPFMKTVYFIMLPVNIILLIFSVLAAVIFLIQRFYRNMTGAEGYLMFTLPASVTSHLLSKLLTSVFWISVTAACAIGLGVLLIPFDQYDTVRTIANMLEMMIQQNFGLSLDHFITFLILYALISVTAFMSILYGSIAIGQLAVSKRALASVGGYLIFYAAQQALGLILLVVLFLCCGQSLFVENPVPPQGMLPALFASIMVIAAIIGCAGFFTARHLFTKRLNLE